MSNNTKKSLKERIANFFQRNSEYFESLSTFLGNIDYNPYN